MAAELEGIPSHGASRIPQYCGHVANGRANGSAVPRIANERGAAEDGNHGSNNCHDERHMAKRLPGLE